VIVHFIRHAQTVWHLENRYAGLTDIDLSEFGREQTTHLKSRVAKLNFTEIYSSDSFRALETARPIANYKDIEFKIEKRFREVNFGFVEGLNPQEFLEKFPKVHSDFNINPALTRLPGGESGEIALIRALDALHEINAYSKAREIAIFSHGTIIRLLLCEILELKVNDYRRIFPIIDNTSISTVLVPSCYGKSKQNHPGSLLSFNK
jgi:broad specificity phosphatase PhoE